MSTKPVGRVVDTPPPATSAPTNGLPQAARAWKPPVPTVESPPWLESTIEESPPVESLSHYDPDYSYSPNHIYTEQFTTDPDYYHDGVSIMTTPAHRIVVANAQDLIGEAQGAYGQVLCEQRFAIGPDLVEGLPESVRWQLVEDERTVLPNRIVFSPDVSVLEHRSDYFVSHNASELPWDPHNRIRLALEVLSPNTRQKDLGAKRALYAALGVEEYLTYNPVLPLEGDPGERDLASLLEANGGIRLTGWRLRRGDYVSILPVQGLQTEAHAVLESAVLGRALRILPAVERAGQTQAEDDCHRHVIQFWDDLNAEWYDSDVRRERQQARDRCEGHAEGQVEGRTEILLSMLEAGGLPGEVRARLRAAWQQATYLPEAAAALDVVQGRAEWQTLLPPER
ncbi:MAG: Uma2 family endonuclease [Caldilineaceae bacterium]|nr:Uma2 family endonuclease [Caldilineaceae bacterium]